MLPRRTADQGIGFVPGLKCSGGKTVLARISQPREDHLPALLLQESVTDLLSEALRPPGTRMNACESREKVTSLTPGTGCNAKGCLVPHLTRLGALPCGEARHR